MRERTKSSLLYALILLSPFCPMKRRLKSYIAKMEEEGIQRVRMFIAITVAYLVFWGPLFLVTLFSYGDYKTETPSASHEVTLHVAFVHAFVNPTLFLVLHKGLRKATIDLLCCNFRGGDVSFDDFPAMYPGNAETGGGTTTGNGTNNPGGTSPGDHQGGFQHQNKVDTTGGGTTTTTTANNPNAIASVNRTYM